jgi:hypothetical protein
MKERGRRRRRSSPPAVAFSPLGGCKGFCQGVGVWISLATDERTM